ncbi:structural protein [Vibrio phage vB_VhaP_PG11]|nr:structural protein [Vibrio phage vB_VhaP_PG11]
MTTQVTCCEEKLSVSSLTGGEKEGSGIFDELMRSVKSHLEQEYTQKRITGDQYTKAYIAALETTMAQGNQYLLNYMLTNQNIRLLDWQIIAAERNAELVQEQINNLKAQTQLLGEQITLAQKQQLQADQDLANSVKQENLLDEQILQAKKQLDVMDSQIAQQTAQTQLVGQQEANALAENTVIVNTAAKVSTETEVLAQKRITEEYQTKDTVAGAPVEGVVGRQIQLYENQAAGYLRDAEQKAAKIFMDSFNTRTSVDDLNTNETLDATVTGTQIKELMNKVREGVNVAPQA